MVSQIHAVIVMKCWEQSNPYLLFNANSCCHNLQQRQPKLSFKMDVKLLQVKPLFFFSFCNQMQVQQHDAIMAVKARVHYETHAGKK